MIEELLLGVGVIGIILFILVLALLPFRINRIGLVEFCNNILPYRRRIIRINSTHIGVKNMSKDFENSKNNILMIILHQ